jgi:hypothetical protein
MVDGFVHRSRTGTRNREVVQEARIGPYYAGTPVTLSGFTQATGAQVVVALMRPGVKVWIGGGGSRMNRGV